MRTILCCVALLFAVLTGSVFADTLYDNGPINGTTDGWTINFGFIVSDTFTANAGDHPTGLAFGAWLAPGDVLQSAEVSITSAEFGGTTFFDGVVNFSQSGCTGNQYGYNVCTETSAWFDSGVLGGGTYWLNLQNATVNTGDPVYWDENSGPSTASGNSVGTIPSESFTVLASTCGVDGLNCTTSTETVPEPGSVWLLMSGGLALSGFLRVRLGKRP